MRIKACPLLLSAGGKKQKTTPKPAKTAYSGFLRLYNIFDGLKLENNWIINNSIPLQGRHFILRVCGMDEAICLHLLSSDSSSG